VASVSGEVPATRQVHISARSGVRAYPTDEAHYPCRASKAGYRIALNLANPCCEGENESMKDYPTDRIRNLALIGHGGTGKTSFAEAAVFVSGAITRLGKVEDGTTTSDFDPDELKRKVTINASLLPCEWDGYKINLIDAPG